MLLVFLSIALTSNTEPRGDLQTLSASAKFQNAQDITLHPLPENASISIQGFEAVTIGSPKILEALKEIRSWSEWDESKQKLTQLLWKINMKNHFCLIAYIAPQGRIMRNALKGEAAIDVHIDQNIEGEPLKSMLKGYATLLFHRISPIKLMNLWIPLQNQNISPLMLLDIRSLKPKHRVHRHVGGFGSDGFSLIYDENQVWHANPYLEFGKAYMFETCRTPHAGCNVPGQLAIEEAALFASKGMFENAKLALEKLDEERMSPILERALTMLKKSIENEEKPQLEICNRVSLEMRIVGVCIPKPGYVCSLIYRACELFVRSICRKREKRND